MRYWFLVAELFKIDDWLFEETASLLVSGT